MLSQQFNLYKYIKYLGNHKLISYEVKIIYYGYVIGV